MTTKSSMKIYLRSESMYHETEAIRIGIRKIADVFGFEYVKAHRDSAICRSINDGYLTMSYLFQDDDDRPDLKPDYLGWTVYATVKVNMETGEATMLDYVLPDGTWVKNGKVMGNTKKEQ